MEGENKESEENYEVEIMKEELSKNLPAHKINILGLAGVGKTSISNRIKHNKFVNTSATISVDIVSILVKVNKKIIQMKLWDACGNDQFAASTPNLFRNSELCILVYSIDYKESFNKIEIWNNIINQYSPKCDKYLIGNKNDLEEKREVLKEEGEKAKNDLDFNFLIIKYKNKLFNILDFDLHFHHMK